MQERIISVRKWKYQKPATEARIQALLEAEGLTPHRWQNEPGYIYQEHKHNYH